MDDLTEIRALMKKTYGELEQKRVAEEKCEVFVEASIAATRAMTILESDERSISAREVVNIYNGARSSPGFPATIAEFNCSLSNLLANDPLATSVLWYSGAITLVEKARNELSRMNHLIFELVDAKARSYVWKPEAIEKHHDESGVVRFLAREWRSSFVRILRHWHELRHGTFQNLTCNKLPQGFDHLEIPEKPDLLLLLELGPAAKNYFMEINLMGEQHGVELFAKLFDLDQRLKKSLGWPCMDIGLSNPPESVCGPRKPFGGRSSPAFRALMEASWKELTSAADAFRICNELVSWAERVMSHVSRICVPNCCLSVSDLYKLIEAGPIRPRGLDEHLVQWMNGRTSLVVTLGRAGGVALVAKELDNGWSIFERRVGRSIHTAESIQSSHAERRNEKAAEAGRHSAMMLKHDWKPTIKKWKDIQEGAVFVSVSCIEKAYSADADAFDLKYVPDSPQQCQWDSQVNIIADYHSQDLLKLLNGAVDRFLNVDRSLGEGHRIKLFRELLELDLKFQRSIGWEVLDS